MARVLVLVAGQCYPLFSLARSARLPLLLRISTTDTKGLVVDEIF
jgi:hypothetical protein